MRRQQWLGLAILVLGVVWIFGCDEESRGGAEGVEVPPDAFCGAYFNVLEDQARNCGQEGPSSGDRERWLESCDATFVRSFKAGIVSYDGDLVTACLQELLDSCDPTFRSPECEEALKGVLEFGEECYSGLECNNGWCNTGESCPGICEEYAPPGGSCGTRPCQRGFHCENNLCVEEGKEGDSCLDGECGGTLRCFCGENLLCTDQETRGTCRQPPPPGKLGESCSGDFPCGDGFYCLTPVGSSYEAMGECKERKMPGQRCERGGSYLSWIYGCVDSVCKVMDDDSEGICAVTEPGDSCAHEGSGCSEGQICDFASNTCEVDDRFAEDLQCVRPLP